jgi:hypothetical protein
VRQIAKKLMAAALVMGIASPAYPWGRQGHRLVALVAQDHLTEIAAANVRALLGKQSMADVASFADTYRTDHPETAGWHFVDIPSSATTYSRDRDCPLPLVRGLPDTASPWRDCAVDRIAYFVDQLKDQSLSVSDKRFALEFLIHLVGDVHQPLHAIGDARGGNSINVLQFGTQQCGERTLCNLHSTWDDGLIEHRRLKEKDYLALLEGEIADLKLESKPVGTPTAWANASHRAAVQAWVPNGALIDKQYFQDEIPVVDRELEFGGLHLADLLNGIFTVPPSAN